MTKEDVFKVEDMACNACVNTITKTLSNNENISNISCNLESIDVEEIISALDNIGFSATIKKKP